MLDVTGTTSSTSTTIRMHSQSALQILYYRVILRCFLWENCCGAIAKYCWEIEWKTNVGDLNIKDAEYCRKPYSQVNITEKKKCAVTRGRDSLLSL